MKAAFEFLAVVLFFATYILTKNIFWATAVAIAAGVIQAAWCLWRYRKLQTMQWVSLVLVVVFGGATILFHNQHFIMWKPSVLFWLMAVGILIAQWRGKNPLQAALGKEISAPPAVWKHLTWAWSLFFTFLGILNIWVAYHFTEKQWVNYKMFGMTGLLIVFAIAQTIYLSSRAEPNQPKDNP